MGANVVITYKNGKKLTASLSSPLSPEDNVVDVILPDLAEKRSILLEDLCYIGMMGSGGATSQKRGGGLPKEVEVVTGERFLLHISPDQVPGNGFFGSAVDESAPFEELFIISSAVTGPAAGRLSLQQPERTAETPQGMANALNRRGDIPEHLLSQIINTYHEKRLTHLPHHNARIGDILISEGLVTREELERALPAAGKKKIGAILMERGLATEDQILAALAAKFSIRFVDLANVAPSRDALNAISSSVINHMQILPIELQGKRLVVASSEPTDTTIVDTLRFITKLNIELVIATSSQISAAIDRYYNKPVKSPDAIINEMEDEQPAVPEQEEEGLVESDSNVILLVNKLLMEAYESNASDIHFEPELEKGPLVVRYRVDGECVPCHEIPWAYKNAVIARLKIMAKLDIAERRKPQSGKIFLHIGHKRIEYRAEITPTVGGHEDAVLRLLTAAKSLSLNEMGFSALNQERFEELLKKPYGIVLCVGPTGSGKTTTLHSALAVINKPQRKIWTAEDPVEIVQKRLRQVQVNPKIGFGFEEALRSFLRADPDVIMIGEMRDKETSKTAIAASLTGHLVFSTLHTNSAPETVQRLIEMGMDPYNFADALLGILAQRLARKLCEQCKVAYRPTREEYDELVLNYGPKWFSEHGLPPRSDGLQLMKKGGCGKCGGTGYKGRIALHELLVGSASVKSAIKNNLSIEDLRDLALQEGMRTLKMDGIQKVFQGITDLQQVNKVCIL